MGAGCESKSVGAEYKKPDFRTADRAMPACATVRSSLLRQCAHEHDRTVDPVLQVIIARDALGKNKDHCGHHLARVIHRRGVGLLQRFLCQVLSKPEHELVLDRAAAHVAVDHEGDPAEHLCFGNTTFARKCAAYAAVEFVGWGHEKLLLQKSDHIMQIADHICAHFIKL